MNHYDPYDGISNAPEAETRPFRLALYWLTEGCLGLLESVLDRFDLYESWLTTRNWRLYDRIAQGLFSVFVCACCFYVGFLVVAAVCWVSYTQGGALLRGGR